MWLVSHLLTPLTWSCVALCGPIWEQRGLSGCLAPRPHAGGMSDLGSQL